MQILEKKKEKNDDFLDILASAIFIRCKHGKIDITKELLAIRYFFKRGGINE